METSKVDCVIINLSLSRCCRKAGFCLDGYDNVMHQNDRIDTLANSRNGVLK